MQNQWLRCLLVVAAFLLISGCSTLKPVSDTGRDADSWQLKGKLSIRMAGQTNIVSIRWLQTGLLSEISLTGPFGVSVAEIQSDGDELIIMTSEGETRYRDEIALSGPWTDSVKLPWRSLAYWVRGVTGPAGNPLKDEYRVDDWLIRVLRRDDLGPRLVVIEHPGASLRLKVREWQFAGRKVPDQ